MLCDSWEACLRALHHAISVYAKTGASENEVLSICFGEPRDARPGLPKS